jgi:hypothetical protein
LHLIESQRVTTASRTALLLGRVLREVVVVVVRCSPGGLVLEYFGRGSCSSTADHKCDDWGV